MGRDSQSNNPIQICCGDWQEFLDLHDKRLKVGAMFVETCSPASPGSRLVLSIQLPAGHGDLHFSVHVVHTRAKQGGKTPGMGIMIHDLDESQRQDVQAALDIARIATSNATTQTDHPAVSLMDAPALDQTSSAHTTSLDEADLFDDVHEGRTGKTSIAAEVAMAAAERLFEDRKYHQAKRELAQVFAEDPYHGKGRILALLIDARLLKAGGDPAAARDKYQLILELEEQHVEARRELQSCHSARGQTGLFGKIFSK